MASEELHKKVETLPDKPGVYQFKDASGRVLYVGKAQSLRNRVRSYMQSPDLLAPKTRRMVEKAVDIDVTVTSTAVEALILECNLIKEQRPRYNIMLRDDKSYPYIKVTIQEEWPRIYFTRTIVRDGARYFGPFTDAKSVRHTIDILNRLFPFRTCHRTITGKDPRPCLSYYIHRCTAPCIGVADHEQYMQSIQQVLLFLDGKQERIIKEMREEMDRAAEELEFEKAARVRDRIKALERTIDRQKITSEDATDRDVVGLATSNGMACAQLFFIRSGKLVGTEHFGLEGAEEEATAPVLASFLQQFYDSAAYVPPQILLQEEIEELDTISQWLGERRGSKVQLVAPQRGQKKQLVQMAVDNASQQLEMLKLRWLNDTQKTTGALVELRDALQLPSTPHRIECYDISNIQGTSAVGSMVVFEGGLPKKSEYRRFKIKTVEGANDFAMLQEVLRRRFKRAIGDQPSAVSVEAEEAEETEEGGEGGVPPLPMGERDASSSPRRGVRAASALEEEDDITEADEGRAITGQRPGNALTLALSHRERGLEPQPSALPEPETEDAALNVDEPELPEDETPAAAGWAAMPDLLMVDGGKGQLSSALEVMDEMGLSLPTVGLAKENEELFLPGAHVGLMLPRTSQSLYLIQRIRDEAHRFAITYHRKVRTKKGFRSALDEVPGIGPTRKKALIKQFGSLKGIREATEEELLAVPGMNRLAVTKLREML